MSALASVAAALLAVANPGDRQWPDLEAAAGAARDALLRREFGPLFEPRQLLRLTVPGAPGPTVVSGVVAAALLRSLGHGMEGWEVSVGRAAEVAESHGYLELTRRFRVIRTQEPRVDRILMSLRAEAGQWRITEILILPAPLGNPTPGPPPAGPPGPS